MYSLFYGAAVGYICFIRITNAATVGAVLLTVFLVLFKKKEFKNAAFNFIMVILGFGATCLIPCIFFSAKNMLGTMLNQVFVFGVTYSSETGFVQKFWNVFSTFRLFLVLLLLPLVISIIYREKWYMKCLSFFSGLLLLIAVTMGNAYTHYFMLFIPHVVLGAYIAYKNGGKGLKARKNILCIICFAVIFPEVRHDIDEHTVKFFLCERNPVFYERSLYTKVIKYADHYVFGFCRCFYRVFIVGDKISFFALSKEN